MQASEQYSINQICTSKILSEGGSFFGVAHTELARTGMLQIEDGLQTLLADEILR